MSAPIVLPADVYDTLEFVALEFGGIEGRGIEEGGGSGGIECPLCPHAMLFYASDMPWGDRACTASHTLEASGLDCLDDRIIAVTERITFKQWCRRLNVVRGA